ncbi:MAG TPA: hypothetical protein VFQ50_04995 [Flavobacterium sp.]|jgi:hypothetical protein|nr:hypothetical protein [Flavobacterium sp.]
MQNNILILALLLLLCAGCKQFDTTVPDKDQLLQKELQAINWNEVDEMPSVAECDSLADKSTRQQCFTNYLASTIQQKISIDTLAVLYPQIDTIKVKITVFADSTVIFEPELSQNLMYDPQKIDSIIKDRLADFPKVSPALKRGVPVKTQFTLPLILNVE